MKANELMIGDKIIAKRIECVGDGGQYQEWNEFGEIIRILEDTVYVMFDKQKDDWEEMDIKDIKPIPLSAEILEKNGFEYINDEYGCWLLGKIELREREPYNGFFEVEINIAKETTYIHYLHELQHVLKLCKSQKDVVL